MTDYMWDIMVRLENGGSANTVPQRLTVFSGATLQDAQAHVHEQVLADLNRARHGNSHWSLGPVEDWTGHLSVHPDKVILVCTNVWLAPPEEQQPEPETEVPPADWATGDTVVMPVTPASDASS